MPYKIWHQSYLASQWSDFSGYCAISWNLKLVQPASGYHGWLHQEFFTIHCCSVFMGADTGGGGCIPQSESGRGTSPQKSRYLQICLKELTKVSRSFKTFKIKWPKFEEKSEFGVGGFDGPESAPPPVKTLWRYHCQYSKWYCISLYKS